MLGETSVTGPLDRDHSEFLLSLAAACQRAQMYPEGHPTLDRAVDQLVERLARLLAAHPSVRFAVTLTRLHVGATASDPASPMHRDLAARLFRRNIGTVRLHRGITRNEVTALLRAVAWDEPGATPLETPRLAVEPLDFGTMVPADKAGERPETVERLPLDEVLAAARAERPELSPYLVRLLGKLADRAERGTPSSRRMAAEQFLGLVHDLRAGGKSPDPVAVEPLEQLPPPIIPGLSPEEAYRSDPYRLLTMQLDMGALGPSAERAVTTLVARGRVKPLVDLMAQLPAGDPLAQAYRPILVGAGSLDRALAAAPVDVETVERLAPLVGPGAIPALLDALAASGDRSLRRRLLEVLAHFGNLVTPEVLARLPGAPWYVQRNLLRLLQMLPEPGVEAVAMEFSRHPDARVRVEGFRLLMRHPGARAKGIMAGLSDPDSSGVRVAVQAAGEDCPPGAAPLLVEGLREGRIDAGLRPAALRALGPMVNEPGVLDLLVEFAARKLPLLGWRIAAKSKESLAALSALARHWSADPRASAILARARKHPDPDIRTAAEA
jgi:hypothetical protein